MPIINPRKNISLTPSGMNAMYCVLKGIKIFKQKMEELF